MLLAVLWLARYDEHAFCELRNATNPINACYL